MANEVTVRKGVEGLDSDAEQPISQTSDIRRSENGNGMQTGRLLQMDDFSEEAATIRTDVAQWQMD